MKMTYEQMVREYPNHWLGITDIQYDLHTGGIDSADVVYTDKTASELAIMSLHGSDIEPLYTTPDRCFHAGAIM